MSTENLSARITLNGATMGTRYSALIHAGPGFDAHALGRRLDAAVSSVDAVMSNWKPESDISRLNRARGDVWIDLPASLIEVLDTALRIEDLSNGAFDIGVGEAVGAWGFGPYAGHDLKAGAASRPVTRRVLELDAARGRARKHAPLCLDLSGIAKGYGVDRMGAVLHAAGLTHWLVSIDGELRAGGPKPDGTPWAIALERPLVGSRDVAGIIEIADMAVATSGTYRHCREVDGTSLSHTIDPASGAPVQGALASVTVLAPTCMEADAWATAILVDGAWPPAGFQAPGHIDAIVMGRDG